MSICVFAPHVDDELFGAGGTILRHGKEYPEEERSVIFSAVGTIWFRHLQSDVPEGDRINELIIGTGLLGINYHHCLTGGGDALDYPSVPNHEIIRMMDNVLDMIRPDIVFIPAPSYHQDHQVTYRQALSALRPTKCLSWPKMILVYESAFCCPPWDGDFKPNFYVDITDFFEKKIEIYQTAYKSQSTKPGFLEGLRKRAEIRGYDAGCKYAEAFQLIYARI